MVNSDPSTPMPVLIGVISIFVIILLRDEFKKDKNKS
jgi:hypothetical protein